MIKKKLIYQGAEAKIFLLEDLSLVIKDRIKKNYRIEELDKKIRKRRTKSEIKLLKKSSEIINSPKVKKESDYEFEMDFIDGKKLSDYLDSFSINEQKKILRKIGESVAKLHSENIIHGDLTTSNMILNKGEIYFIDFGLGYISRRIEDKAVDLHLLRQALEARHFKNWEILFKEFLKGYKNFSNDYKKVLERFKAVERRGRYKRSG